MSVLNFMVAYVFLIIAFATTFMIAFPTNDAFALVPTAIVKVQDRGEYRTVPSHIQI